MNRSVFFGALAALGLAACDGALLDLTGSGSQASAALVDGETDATTDSGEETAPAPADGAGESAPEGEEDVDEGDAAPTRRCDPARIRDAVVAAYGTDAAAAGDRRTRRAADLGLVYDANDDGTLDETEQQALVDDFTAGCAARAQATGTESDEREGDRHGRKGRGHHGRRGDHGHHDHHEDGDDDHQAPATDTARPSPLVDAFDADDDGTLNADEKATMRATVRARIARGERPLPPPESRADCEVRPAPVCDGSKAREMVLAAYGAADQADDRRARMAADLGLVYDANDDGTLDETEQQALVDDFAAGCTAREARREAALDANGDGTVSDEERAAGNCRSPEEGRHHHGRHRHGGRDGEHRGVRPSPLVAEFDANGDGSLDAEEKGVMRPTVRARIAAGERPVQRPERR